MCTDIPGRALDRRVVTDILIECHGETRSVSGETSLLRGCGRLRRMTRLTRGASAAGVAVVLATALCGPADAKSDTVYETRFRDPEQVASDWGFPDGETKVTEDGYTAAFSRGALTINLNATTNAWLSPDFGVGDIAELPDDQAIEARVASNTGDRSATFGVACRAKLRQDSVGYVFLVGTDGYFTIGRYDGRGNAKAIVNAKGTGRTGAVDEVGTNIVRGECVGESTVKLALIVNGKKVATAVDKAPPKNLGDQAYVVTEVEEGARSETEFTRFAAHSL